MTENPNVPDLSFLDAEPTVSFHIKDLLYTLLRNVHWLVLFGAIGALVANFSARRQDRIYESNARIVLRGNSSESDNSLREASVNYMFSDRPFYNTSVNNEVMILTSKTTMLKTVENLHLNVSYSGNSKVIKRKKDLYGSSPLLVDFIDNSESDYVAMTLTPVSEHTVRLEYGEYEPLLIHLDDTQATPFGRIAVHPTWYYTTECLSEPITVVHAPSHLVADHYRKTISVSRDGETNTIVNINLRDLSARRAADVINELIRVYNEEAVKDKKRIIAYTYDYINERLSQLHLDLNQQESVIASFKRDNQLINLDSYGISYLNTNNEYSQEVDKLKQRLSLAQYLLQLNENNNSSTLLPPPIGIDDATIANTMERYNELTMRLNQTHNTGNPVVQKLTEEQQKARADLSQLLGVYSASIQRRIDDAQSIVSRASGKMRQIPEQQLYLENVERLQKIKEELYLNLLSKREELLISQPSIEGNAKIIDEARVNETPVSPNVGRATVLGLLLGLLIPIGAFLLRRMLDTKVRYQSDVKLRTTIPFLCEIPTRKKSDIRDIVVVDGKQDSLSESFRLLRSKIDFLGLTKSGQQSAVSSQQSQFSNLNSRVFMVTSLLPASGKTFVASNTAACFAIAGKRVMLIDMDLRKGSLTHRFYSRRKEGLSDLLAGKVSDYRQLICHDVVATGLDTIFSGMLPPNPAELLGNGRIEQLLCELRQHYDYIFLDSAPLSVVDNTIIQRLVDSSLFVVRSGKYDKRVLNEMEEIYQTHSFPGMAVLLNDVSYPKSSPIDHLFGLDYGYGYGKRYSYAYHGYSDYRDDNNPKNEEA